MPNNLFGWDLPHDEFLDPDQYDTLLLEVEFGLAFPEMPRHSSRPLRPKRRDSGWENDATLGFYTAPESAVWAEDGGAGCVNQPDLTIGPPSNMDMGNTGHFAPSPSMYMLPQSSSYVNYPAVPTTFDSHSVDYTGYAAYDGTQPSLDVSNASAFDNFNALNNTQAYSFSSEITQDIPASVGTAYAPAS